MLQLWKPSSEDTFALKKHNLIYNKVYLHLFH